MIEELRQIDTSTVEALQALKHNRTRLEELVAKAEERKAAVSPEIYARVTSDYSKRLADVESEARPLREKAHAELARLMTLHARLEAALAQARLDQEELEFRHTLGELDDRPYGERREEVASAVDRCTTDFQDADRLKGLFAEVLPAGEEPAAPPVPVPVLVPPPAAPAPKEAAPAPPPPAPPRPEPAAPVRPAPPKPAPARVAAPAPPAPPPPPPIREAAAPEAIPQSDGGLGAQELRSRRSPHGTGDGHRPAPEPDGSEATIADMPSPVANVPPPPPPAPKAPLPPPPPVAAASAAARRSVPLPPAPPKPAKAPATDATVVLSAPPPPPSPPPAVDAGEGTQLVKWARLLLIRPDGSEQFYAIGPTATIGRTRQNDIVIEEADVSRQHARLVLENGSYVIRDLGSNNGTWVNDERLEGARVLVHGDRVAIGNQNFRFEHQ